jgi:cytochrome c
MPLNAPGSLTDKEVYSLAAYILHANQLIDSAVVLNKISLPKIAMPAQEAFIADDRKGGPKVK